MKTNGLIRPFLVSTFLASALLASTAGFAANSAVDAVKHNAEGRIRSLIEPLLNKYCQDECKLMSVDIQVDIKTPEEIAPGFDEVVTGKGDDLAPSNAKIKLLVNDKVGPVSRSKLTDLIDRYLDTLDYPVKVDVQLAHFPLPIGSEGRAAELRDKAAKQFKTTIQELFDKFCPQQCLMADFNLQTEVVNAEEAQFGALGEFLQDGSVAIRVKDISATILMDESLTPEERNNVLEMARLKTNYFKNVNLTGKSMKFPQPTDYAINSGTASPLARGIAGAKSSTNQKDESKSTTTSDNRSATSSNSNSTNTESRNSKTENKDINHTNSTSNNNVSESKQESNLKQERFERIEKIERVENGDAVQKELEKFKVYGMVFACSILSLLIFIAMAGFRPKSSPTAAVHKVIQSLAADPVNSVPPPLPMSHSGGEAPAGSASSRISVRYEIERLMEELMAIYAQQPRVAKQVFTRVLTEDGVETTAQYIHIFGEGIVVDMLRDPSLQSDLSELMEFYAKNPMELDDEEKLDLLRKVHNRTVAGKLVVMGNRSSNLFDFLAEMDGLQILELIRNETLTVKSIVLTQCDPQKRAAIYAQLDEETRMRLLTELSRIDYLPRDYIFNVAHALKRKRRENPRLNTEALPGSEVLVSLLERTGPAMQRTVVKNLEVTNPESARTVKAKLVSVDTLRYLRDSQLLEVILSLRHDELLQFLKGAAADIKDAIFAKSPKELIAELEEELSQVGVVSRETYSAVERKVLNRMKLMANDGLINLIETNERMFAEASQSTGFIETLPPGASVGTGGGGADRTNTSIKNMAG